MYGKGLLTGLKITLGHHLEKNITTQYPEEKPDLSPGYRGSLSYDITRCIACGACTRACPNHVLAMEAVKGKDGKRRARQFTIDLQYCMFCALCVEVCPTGCLFFSPDFELAVFQRSQIKRTFTQDVEEADIETPKADNPEVDDEIQKKRETMKKLASELGRLKKEAEDETLSEEEKAKKAEKAAKIAKTIARLNQEIKTLKGGQGGNEE